MTLDLLHVTRDYTLTRTSIPKHAGKISPKRPTHYRHRE